MPDLPKPTPYQARILRLCADGFGLRGSPSRMQLSAPQGMNYKDRSEAIRRARNEVRHSVFMEIPRHSAASMIERGYVLVHQEEYERSSGRSYMTETVELNPEALSILDDLDEADYDLPERQTNEHHEAQILEALRQRYCPPEWALFQHLRMKTGWFGGKLRTVDAFAMNMYPSNGHVRVGFEIKCSRSDFFREVNDPSKREGAVRFTDEFYFVVPAGMLSKDEVPEDAGLLVWNAATDKLRIVVRSPAEKSPPMPRTLVASMSRRVARLMDYEDIILSARHLTGAYHVFQQMEAEGSMEHNPERALRTIRFWLTNGGREDMRPHLRAAAQAIVNGTFDAIDSAAAADGGDVDEA